MIRFNWVRRLRSRLTAALKSCLAMPENFPDRRLGQTFEVVHAHTLLAAHQPEQLRLVDACEELLKHQPEAYHAHEDWCKARISEAVRVPC
jgi:hypothetical protein